MMEKVKNFFSHENADNKELTLQRQFDNLYRTLHSFGQVTDEFGEVIDLEKLLDKLELVRKGGESMLEIVPETYGSYKLREAAEKLLQGETIATNAPTEAENGFDETPAEHLATMDGTYSTETIDDKTEIPSAVQALLAKVKEIPLDQYVNSSGETYTYKELETRIISVVNGDLVPTALPRKLGDLRLRDLVLDIISSRIEGA